MRELEEEVNMLKSNGALSSEEREEEIKQMEVYRSHSKFMKNKVRDRHTHRVCLPHHICFNVLKDSRFLPRAKKVTVDEP